MRNGWSQELRKNRKRERIDTQKHLKGLDKNTIGLARGAKRALRTMTKVVKHSDFKNYT